MDSVHLIENSWISQFLGYRPPCKIAKLHFKRRKFISNLLNRIHHETSRAPIPEDPAYLGVDHFEIDFCQEFNDNIFTNFSLQELAGFPFAMVHEIVFTTFANLLSLAPQFALST